MISGLTELRSLLSPRRTTGWQSCRRFLAATPPSDPRNPGLLNQESATAAPGNTPELKLFFPFAPLAVAIRLKDPT